MYRAQAIYQFDGAVPTDLPLKEGEIVTIIGKLPGNLWWEGESADGRIGTFPYNYVNELPPEDDFREFIGKTGISNFDIIQFVTNECDTYQGKSSVLCHVICGDGEYIMEMFHEDFVNLNLLIQERFPLLELPSLPSKDTQRDVYKKLVHDYFAYFGIHQMVTPVILKWLQSIPKTCVSPCPHWDVYIHTTNIVSEEEAEVGGKSLLSVTRGERYVLLDIEDDLLQLESETKQGWCSLRYCEIEWMDHSKDDDHSQLTRIIPFSLPSIQCSEDLRINHITMQSLHMADRYGVNPTIGDTVILRVHLYIWNSLRGYMYQFYNTNKNPLYHVIGSNDSSIITELIDHKIQLMHEGEKTMIILHSSTDAPKEVMCFLEGCISFYLCYILDLRVVKKAGNETILPNIILLANASNKPVKPVKPVKPAYLYHDLAYSIDVGRVKEKEEKEEEVKEVKEVKEEEVKEVKEEVKEEEVKIEEVKEEKEVKEVKEVNVEEVDVEEVKEVKIEEVKVEEVKEVKEVKVVKEVKDVKEAEEVKEKKEEIVKEGGQEKEKLFPSQLPSITHSPSSPSTRVKPQLPPKPPKELLSTGKAGRPELPPKPPHLSKLSHSLSLKPPPPKPAKPLKFQKPSKSSKPVKPAKPKRTSISLSSSDSHENVTISGHGQQSLSYDSVQSPIIKE